MNFKIFLLLFQIFKISSSFTINCNFQSINLTSIGNFYICQTRNIPTTSGTIITNITGTHENGKSNFDVEGIDIQGNLFLSFFPRGFGNFFPNIKAFMIHYTSITTLYGDELDEFPKLQYFIFGQSNLTTISSHLFEKTPNLVHIWFDWNTIEKVGHYLFTPLNISMLQDVSFFNNICINRWATSQVGINNLINELREKCPFDDEDLSTTTTLVSTTLETTTEDSKCKENVEEFVCELKDVITEVQEDITTLKFGLSQTNDELKKSNERSNELQIEFYQLRREMELKLSLKDKEIDDLRFELEMNKDEFRKANNALLLRMELLEEELKNISTNCGCN
ncbi:hypothetical protein PVAND_016231 [Polypedilum vanderplanki]|uniref:Uncharacterized protein n=1 Tax=Polypedilum vanderplanki TaxID=319348 RepID=A0A9J6BEH8_POLVA|nr:hypothetical protein PVAND_016231 [Polypedilum vanderplanki]